MVDRQSRRTQIHLSALHDGHVGSQENIHSLTKRTDAIAIPPAARDVSLHRKGAVLTTAGPRPLPAPQQARFPVKAYGGMKLASLWSSYEKICGLRLGADFHVTLAQETDSPHRQVSIRRFPGKIQNTELQILHQIQHASFVAALETFRFDGTTYVVFEHLPISLHEMQRSRRRIESLHLPAILGPVRSFAPATAQTSC